MYFDMTSSTLQAMRDNLHDLDSYCKSLDDQGLKYKIEEYWDNHDHELSVYVTIIPE